MFASSGSPVSAAAASIAFISGVDAFSAGCVTVTGPSSPWNAASRSFTSEPAARLSVFLKNGKTPSKLQESSPESDAQLL